jgi:hypothetical protein
MLESKPCFQQNFLILPTPCFIRAGSTPCESSGCLVSDALNGKKVEQTNFDDMVLIEGLCHSACRISSLSEDNDEYLERMSDKGETHLLSILE